MAPLAPTARTLRRDVPFTPKARRVRPTPVEHTRFKATNIEDGEIIHQRCVILTGQYHYDTSPASLAPGARPIPEDFVSATVTDAFAESRPAQNWPAKDGQWKVMILLQPGENHVRLDLFKAALFTKNLELKLTHVPMTQIPPLHLAVMVAKDSPLLIDCPPSKRGTSSSAHSSLDAVVAKFRMTAYMWQAMTAEDMREKGFGRLSFRLDEEWGTDTTTIESSRPSRKKGIVPKVRIIKSESTVAEITAHALPYDHLGHPAPDDMSPSCPPPHRGYSRDNQGLFDKFQAAIHASGDPFASSDRPVVAGLILDSHYDATGRTLYGAAAQARHARNGASLATFGSHLTYSWPRFMEEVPDCLLDSSPCGDMVACGSGLLTDEERTLAVACKSSQGAFLRQVGQAFGTGHTAAFSSKPSLDLFGGKDAKGWHRNFIAQAERQPHVTWSLRDALRLKGHDHFRAPGLRHSTYTFANGLAISPVQVSLDLDNDGEEQVRIFCQAGLAYYAIFDDDDRILCKFSAFFKPPASETDGTTSSYMVTLSSLEEHFDRGKPLTVYGLGLNGMEKRMTNLWALLRDLPHIKIPRSSLKLVKRTAEVEEQDDMPPPPLPCNSFVPPPPPCGLFDDFDATSIDTGMIHWAVLLSRRGSEGKVASANAIDFRVGCVMDGAVIHYSDGATANCGPASKYDGTPWTFGGHASQKHELADHEIIKVELNKGPYNPFGSNEIQGICMTLSDGTKWGELNLHENGRNDVRTLLPGDGHRISGFFGRSERETGYTTQFGLLTVPKDAILPDTVYDLPELRPQQMQQDDRPWSRKVTCYYPPPRIERSSLREPVVVNPLVVEAEDPLSETVCENDDSDDSEDYDELSEHTIV